MADCPISILSSDALEYIFWMNTERNDKPPSALTLVRTSQVCMSWRHLILSSPSLWGQVFDLDYFKNREFREEIIRRTGQSVISLKSRPGWPSRGGATYTKFEVVVSFLEQNWQRLKSIDLSFYSEAEEWTEYKDRVWTVLQRPAPFLHDFSFSSPDAFGFEDDPSNLRPPKGLVLFGNYAPQLKIFDAPELPFNPRASWLGYLRELRFTEISALPDLLLALQNMPLLEVLYLCNSDSPQEYPLSNWTPLPDVRLPSLKNVEVHFDVKLEAKQYLNFLRRLKPMALCFPRFTIFAEEDTVSDEQNLTDFIEILTIFAIFCGLDQSTSVNVGIFDDFFIFKVLVLSLTEVASINIGVGDSEATLDNRYKKAFLSTFQRSSFRSMGELSFAVWIAEVTLRQEPEIDEFLQMFQAITHLETSPQSANFFQQILLDAGATLFPLLHTIEFSSGPWGYKEHALPVQTFVRAMLATGHPIARIYFSIPNEDAVYVTKFKEEFPELQVHLGCAKPHLSWEY
ncbi:hypothetical protein CVT26_011959 [Gymnopilus dilepis]|uniref:F-box domain-containing protein n=1 Tax=Gymnopilus dilepis TaxID=231916 RepID=A0A409YHS4_9AGAR|nr:hypothetical protein CVT26_011959 [Gymnopilus dilepis]